MFDLSLDKVREGVVLLIALLLSLAVHEFGHAIVADKLGDRTPRLQGRVTLNPLAHADPIGTFLFPMIAFFGSIHFLFGWGKPVQINPVAFTRKLRMKTAHLLVAAAGPAMNVVLALLVTVLLAVLLATGVLDANSPITSGIWKLIMLNWVLCFFNLIPVPPLDGGAVLTGLLPDRYGDMIQSIGQYGFLVIIGLLITGAIQIFLWPAIQLTRASMHLVHGLV